VEGEWAGGPSPPPCGQLTRCFSAVAELLVLYVPVASAHVFLLSATKCRPMILVSTNIKYMQILAGVPSARGRRR